MNNIIHLSKWLPSLDLKKSANFFLIAGPCAIEDENTAFGIAEYVLKLTQEYRIPFIFKGSYRKANRTGKKSFTGIGDIKALEILKKIGKELYVPTVTDIHESTEASVAARY